MREAHDVILEQLFGVLFKQLSLKDIEGEVRKAVLKAATACLARFEFGNKLLRKEVDKALKVLQDRLANEITLCAGGGGGPSSNSRNRRCA